MAEPFDADHVNQYEHETWSRCADNYLDGWAGMTRETVSLLIEAAGIRNGTSLLDIGSGPGHVADALAKAGGVVTGIDFSASMVEVARRSYPHVTFQEGSAEQLPFDTGSFDAVVSNFVVHHLARPEVVFKEIQRVLKPGGRFAFTVFADPAAQSSLGAFFAAVEMYHDLGELPHGPLFGVTDLSMYESMLGAGGLADLKFDFRPIIWRTRSLDPVVEACWTWGNLVALPQDVQDKIDAATRERLKPFAADDGYAFPHEVLLGCATRP